MDGPRKKKTQNRTQFNYTVTVMNIDFVRDPNEGHTLELIRIYIFFPSSN